ncbi:hypothetical protein [Kribbella ginsengisoli]|uniref:hypothetical protein n=1 Tax=Kribbella ginsengisoli TaxID=363865 RepID=UPI0031E18257
MAYRRTGVPAYRRTGVPAYRRTGVPAYRRTGVPACRRAEGRQIGCMGRSARDAWRQLASGWWRVVRRWLRADLLARRRSPPLTAAMMV